MMTNSSPTSDLDSLLQDLERTCQARHHPEELAQEPGKSGGRLPYRSPLSSNSSSGLPVVSADGYAVVQDSLRKDVIRELESTSTLIKKRQFEDNILTEKSNLDQSKWEYVGYGIWEDSQTTSPGPEEYVLPIQETSKSQAVLNRHVEISTTGKSFSSGITTKTLDRSISSSSTSNDNGHGAAAHQTVTAASSATKELDDLMNSLGRVETKTTPHPRLLDEMLDNLHIDMNTQGVTSSPKGVCYKCTKPILGQVVTALGRPWHPEHFTCFHCDKALGLETYFERDSQAYCEIDYHALFSPRCANCKKAILNKCVSALDQTWHPECFACSSCHKPFGDDCYHEKNGQPFCQTCFQGRFLPKCGKCVQPIEDNFISSLDQHWHMDCFVCEECSTPFLNGNYFEHNGKPYCETHYHSLRGSLCAGCHKAISGRCITAMFKKYHPEHFVCSFCLKQLNRGTFKESNERPYCHECHGRLFG